MGIKHFLSVLLLCLPLTLSAKPLGTVSTDRLQVTVFDDKCTSAKVIKDALDAGVPESITKLLKKAVVVWDGKTLQACYLEREGDYIIVDETGDGGPLDKKLFKKPLGV